MLPYIREIQLAEYDQCLSLWLTCFPHLTPSHFARFLRGKTPGNLLRGVFLGDQLISAVQIIPRALVRPHASCLSAYVTNVATLPQYRRQGFAIRCLQDALQVMEQEGYSFSRLLATGQGPYARLGWLPDPLPILKGRLPAVLPALLPGYRLRAVTAEDLPAIVQIYMGFNRDRPLSVVRSWEYWNDWLYTPDHGFLGSTVVCLRNDKIVGYVQFILNAALRHCVTEIGAGDSDSEALTALLWGVADLIRQDGGATIRLAVPADANLRTAIETLFEDVQAFGLLPWMVHPLSTSCVVTDFADSPLPAYTWLSDAL